MALNVDLETGDLLIVPKDSGAQIRVIEKTGRKTRLSIESAKPVQILRAKDGAVDNTPVVRRPTIGPSAPLVGRPKI